MIEPSRSLRAFLRALQGRRAADVPWAPLRKPLAECHVALVVSSVCIVDGAAHEYPGVDVGAPVLREFDGDFDVSDPPRPDARAGDGAANLERNVALALDGLRAAVADDRLGELNRRHQAICGPTAATSDAVAALAPQAAERLRADQVDVALLVPT